MVSYKYSTTDRVDEQGSPPPHQYKIRSKSVRWFYIRFILFHHDGNLKTYGNKCVRTKAYSDLTFSFCPVKFMSNHICKWRCHHLTSTSTNLERLAPTSAPVRRWRSHQQLLYRLHNPWRRHELPHHDNLGIPSRRCCNIHNANSWTGIRTLAASVLESNRWPTC
jgi:hypothetical protein